MNEKQCQVTECTDPKCEGSPFAKWLETNKEWGFLQLDNPLRHDYDRWDKRHQAWTKGHRSAAKHGKFLRRVRRIY